MPSLRLILVFILLAGQCLIAVWQHLGDTRYFAWAPNDYIMVYEPRVIVGGRKLSDAEVKERYLVSPYGIPIARSDLRRLNLSPSLRYIWEDPPRHLLDRIRWYEETLGRGDHARVTVDYQLNGDGQRQWRWP